MLPALTKFFFMLKTSCHVLTHYLKLFFKKIKTPGTARSNARGKIRGVI